MTSFIWVFLGGGFGSICRYGVNRLVVDSGYPFPLATLIANLLSSLLLGALVVLSMRQLIAIEYRLLLMTGFCGGFSTFSTFSSETFQLLEQGHYFYAFANVVISVALGLICIYLGMKWAQ